MSETGPVRETGSVSETGNGPGDGSAEADDGAVWCDECHRLVEADELTEDGECPTCGTELVELDRRRVPGYLKFLIVATVIYVIYRIVQLVMLIVHHL